MKRRMRSEDVDAVLHMSGDRNTYFMDTSGKKEVIRKQVRASNHRKHLCRRPKSVFTRG